MDSLAAFIASLLKATDANPQYRQIEEWASAGNAHILHELAIALESSADLHRYPHSWQPRAVLAHVEAVLALTPGIGFAEALAELSTSLRWPDVTAGAAVMEAGRHASMLADAQGPGALVQLFEKHSADDRYSELLLQLAQEMTVREVCTSSLPPIAGFWERMRHQQHPLTWLPLHLTAIEVELPLPNYGLRSRSVYSPFGPYPIAEAAAAPPVWLLGPHAEETTSSEQSDLILTSVAGWRRDSNGVLEARTYELAGQATLEHLSPSFFLSLGMDASRGGDEGRIRVVSASPQRIFGILFGAAANGGAYGGGRYAAYGRLDAWQSMAGLVGLSIHEGITAVVDEALAATWVVLEASTDWFQQVAWDIAIAALRRDGNHLSILAATDTD